MTKKDLIQKVAEATIFPETEVEIIFNATLDTIMKALVKGKDKVSIINFGAFSVSLHEEQTRELNGKTVHIPESYRVHFKAGKKFKDIINKKKSEKVVPISEATKNSKKAKTKTNKKK